DRAGGVGRSPSHAVGAAAGSAAGADRRVVGWVAGLDRVGRPGPHRARLAVVASPAGRAEAGGAGPGGCGGRSCCCGAGRVPRRGRGSGLPGWSGHWRRGPAPPLGEGLSPGAAGPATDAGAWGSVAAALAGASTLARGATPPAYDLSYRSLKRDRTVLPTP